MTKAGTLSHPLIPVKNPAPASLCPPVTTVRGNRRRLFPQAPPVIPASPPLSFPTFSIGNPSVHPRPHRKPIIPSQPSVPRYVGPRLTRPPSVIPANPPLSFPTFSIGNPSVHPRPHRKPVIPSQPSVPRCVGPRLTRPPPVIPASPPSVPRLLMSGASYSRQSPSVIPDVFNRESIRSSPPLRPPAA